ncbi:hypothetical protein DLE60_01185 [Micromonospora globispora]|uniref:Anti-sigma factor antagonist n=1 Tax=Micromonospora globispora TaxID=1450148 RepID=A0A317K6D3_9ACTN|nr:STAS domain-containing protein [Micromonospora globispora]PWU47362.1 hypothetical protein DLJ46_15080 [Micromonospora globispora]PWU62275.1 hypothetical protein DLE60_01185 [Micromonospora globispora]RQX07585.1 hypothetical protein DKL51_00730 [Micromonospora globispora]
MFTHRMSARLKPRPYRDPLLSLHVATSGRVTVVVVRGEVDMSNAHLLTDLAGCLLCDHPPRLVLDLAKVTFFGAAGINALLRIQQAATADAVDLVLCDPSRITVRVLTATGDIDRFRSHTTTTTA